MDSVDKSAYYILYMISRNKLVRLGKGYSLNSFFTVEILQSQCEVFEVFLGFYFNI